MARAASVDREEVAKFAAQAEDWWNAEGSFAPLHRLNPVRLQFIRDRLAARFGREPLGERPLTGLRLLDIGCGGGLLSEPLSRLGATVTGIDAADQGIAAARHHAAETGLAIDYRATTAEAMAAKGESFDAVLAMEIVEHVADVTSFMAAAGALVRPGGALIAATLNRTPKSFLLAIVGAEYLLRWVPRGTHDWRRFVRPSELARALRAAGLDVVEICGATYNPISDTWGLAPGDVAVNYMVLAAKD